MNEIRQWVLTISAVSIISGILISLVPKSSYKNLYKTITGLVLVYTFLQPFIDSKDIDFNINDYLFDNYSVSENADKYAQASIIRSAEKAIEEILIEESEALEIECSFKCSCKIKGEELIVEQISVKSKSYKLDKNSIEELAEKFGFDKTVLVFEGEQQ